MPELTLIQKLPQGVDGHHGHHHHVLLALIAPPWRSGAGGASPRMEPNLASISTDFRWATELTSLPKAKISMSSNRYAGRGAGDCRHHAGTGGSRGVEPAGNLHFSVQVLPNAVRVTEDPAVVQLLTREHIAFRKVTCVFLPLSAGAHHHHHAHGHEHHHHGWRRHRSLSLARAAFTGQRLGLSHRRLCPLLWV